MYSDQSQTTPESKAAMASSTNLFRRSRFFLIAACALFLAGSSVATAEDPPTEQARPAHEFYELRIYRIFDYEKQQLATAYFRDALIPGLSRQNVDRVGVFTNAGDVNDHSLFVIIPWRTLDAMTASKATLDADEEYQSLAKAYLVRSPDDPVFQRIDSWLMKSFESMPVIEPSPHLGKADRVCELRMYESPTEDAAAKKVQMFNEGETDLMRETGLGPVFFGSTLIGKDCPSLIYMLSAESADAHKKNWDAFRASPKWAEIKDLPQYKGTVSNITSWTLEPVDFSQL